MCQASGDTHNERNVMPLTATRRAQLCEAIALLRTAGRHPSRHAVHKLVGGRYSTLLEQMRELEAAEAAEAAERLAPPVVPPPAAQAPDTAPGEAQTQRPTCVPVAPRAAPRATELALLQERWRQAWTMVPTTLEAGDPALVARQYVAVDFQRRVGACQYALREARRLQLQVVRAQEHGIAAERLRPHVAAVDAALAPVVAFVGAHAACALLASDAPALWRLEAPQTDGEGHCLL